MLSFLPLYNILWWRGPLGAICFGRRAKVIGWDPNHPWQLWGQVVHGKVTWLLGHFITWSDWAGDKLDSYDFCSGCFCKGWDTVNNFCLSLDLLFDYNLPPLSIHMGQWCIQEASQICVVNIPSHTRSAHTCTDTNSTVSWFSLLHIPPHVHMFSPSESHLWHKSSCGFKLKSTGIIGCD